MKKTIIAILLAVVLPVCGVVAMSRVPAKGSRKTKTTQVRSDRKRPATTKKKTAAMTENDVENAVVVLETTMGTIKLKLYNDTPLHKSNFLKLVGEGFYDGVLFHRVIDEFMVQTGDPESKDAKADDMLGAGDLGYTVEAEIDYPRHWHKYGALAAARTADQVNPERRSSASQFYIVTGRKYSEQELQGMEERAANLQQKSYFDSLVKKHRDEINAMFEKQDTTGLETLQQQLIDQTMRECKVVSMPQNVRNDYLTVGGTPHLDGQYTVFGEVMEGMDVVEKIQKAETNSADRPKEDIRIISARLDKSRK